MSVILGINAFHPDAAACVVVDGQLRAAIAEERLGKRIKHYPAFPIEAARRVLQDAGVELKDVTHVAVARDSHANRRAKVRYTLAHPVRSAGAVLEHLRRNAQTRGIPHMLAEGLGFDPASFRPKVVFVEHHLAHVASAYYLSPFETLTAGFSYDASGDFASAMAVRCEGHRLVPVARVCLPHSLGFYYTALCQFIGFDEFGEEYKVMGLSAYGQDVHGQLMRTLVELPKDGWFRLKAGIFGMHEGMPSEEVDDRGHVVIGRFYTDRLVGMLGPPRKRSDPIGQREKDIAKSVQVRFEEAAVHCMRRLHELVPTDHLAMAGGCALNGVANARILRETPFRRYYLQSASSDDGTCLGAAYYCYHQVLGQTRRFHMQHAFWGPQYPEPEIRRAAESSRAPLARYDDDRLLDTVVDHLRAGKVIGWYQGRSEWGPRALGNRSILADPSLPQMKDTINAKIKRRESFRPFAPTVLREHVGEIFEQDVDSPFMMHVVKIRPAWRPKLPAVCHVDDTGRLQSLSREENPRYYDLIQRFARATGVPVVLNTSFNENEPIVDTPQQAVACFLRTDMDLLVLGNYILSKSGQERHGSQ
jgi:carbamoyltransferase